MMIFFVIVCDLLCYVVMCFLKVKFVFGYGFDNVYDEVVYFVLYMFDLLFDMFELFFDVCLLFDEIVVVFVVIE